MAVAEVPVPGLIDIRSPGGTSFVGEVVVVYLLAGDNHFFLFGRSPDEEALVH